MPYSLPLGTEKALSNNDDDDDDDDDGSSYHLSSSLHIPSTVPGALPSDTISCFCIQHIPENECIKVEVLGAEGMVLFPKCYTIL